MVYPQIHISRKLSHFLTTLCVKAALHFWRCIFAAFAFCIVGVFKRKSPNRTLTIVVLLFSELQKKPSRVFPPLKGGGGGEFIVMALY